MFIRFFIFIFIILVCNYLCRLLRKFRNNKEQTMVETGWFQVESVLLGTFNWMAASLCLLLSNFFSASWFVFKVTLLCFLFVVIVNTIHKQFPALLHVRAPLPLLSLMIHLEETRLSAKRNPTLTLRVLRKCNSAQFLSCINLQNNQI